MNWFWDSRKYWGKLPGKYLNDWLGNKLVLTQKGETVEFECGRKLRLVFVGGGFWNERSMTPVPTKIEWFFQELTDAETMEEEEIFRIWQQTFPERIT